MYSERIVIVQDLNTLLVVFSDLGSRTTNATRLAESAKYICIGITLVPSNSHFNPQNQGIGDPIAESPR